MYVENNAPLLRNENLQKSINLLQQHHAKLIKQQQLAQVNQMKPKLPNNVVDASPVVISRIEVVCLFSFSHTLVTEIHIHFIDLVKPNSSFLWLRKQFNL